MLDSEGRIGRKGRKGLGSEGRIGRIGRKGLGRIGDRSIMPRLV